MTDEELAAIEERADAATPGPWRISRLRDGSDLVMSDGAPAGVVADCRDERGFNGDPDATFIAAARSDVPALLAEVRRLRASIAAFSDTAECAVEAFENRDSGGMSVPFRGDFCSATPSVISSLRWWVRELRASLGGTGT